ncbi:YceI family protein [Vampirovibrio chlorellavorus]|uniref:YceI family protein n=1 Tax=Vampirovibrio chlorellavorus TaxID=758823 RepID=UPI0026EDE9A2|nr:YceI family protein [Vampirovibrio chlorellavorus]
MFNRFGVRLVSALMTVGLCTSVSLAKPLHFKVHGDNKDQISFNSDAPVEVITGNTQAVQGDIKLDDSFKLDAKHPFAIAFTVDLASIDTGIPLRNEHMRDNFLETKQYPQAKFVTQRVQFRQKPDLSKAQSIKLDAIGDLTVHGVTVRKTIPLTVDYTPGKSKQPATVRVRGKFPVTLAQHKIKRPEAIFVKLAETVYVSVDVTGKAITQ